MPCEAATWVAELNTNLCSFNVVVKVVFSVWVTEIILYMPVTGDTVLPDITNNDTGWAMVYCFTFPGIVTVKSPENCVAIALISFIMFVVWNTLAKELLQLFTTSDVWEIAFPLASSVKPIDEKFMSDML